MDVTYVDIKQEYHCIDVKDAITMLSLMNELVNKINMRNETIYSFLNSANEDEEVPFDVAIAREEITTFIKQYEVLSNLGFVATIDFDKTFNISDYK